MVKEILEWNDEKFNESLNEDGPKCYIKAFCTGVIEGAVDLLVVVGIIYYITLICNLIKKTKK